MSDRPHLRANKGYREGPCEGCGRLTGATGWMVCVACSYERARLRQRSAAERRQARLKAAAVERVERQLVLERAGGLCDVCGKPIEGAFDVDHIVPLADGGEHSYANTRPLHPDCHDYITGRQNMKPPPSKGSRRGQPAEPTTTHEEQSHEQQAAV